MATFDIDELDEILEDIVLCGKKYGIRKLLEVISEALEEIISSAVSSEDKVL